MKTVVFHTGKCFTFCKRPGTNLILTLSSRFPVYHSNLLLPLDPNMPSTIYSSQTICFFILFALLFYRGQEKIDKHICTDAIKRSYNKLSFDKNLPLFSIFTSVSFIVALSGQPFSPSFTFNKKHKLSLRGISKKTCLQNFLFNLIFSTASLPSICSCSCVPSSDSGILLSTSLISIISNSIIGIMWMIEGIKLFCYRLVEISWILYKIAVVSKQEFYIYSAFKF